MISEDNLTAGSDWDLIIHPKRNWWDLRLGELWRYRDLIRLMVWRDFVALYKQTILGPLWYLIKPILTTVVFTVIFNNVAKIPTDGLPPFLFYLAGNTIWGYFSSCIVSTSTTFSDNAYIFGKVYFPRLSVPISILLSKLISFAINLGVFVAFLIYFILSGSGVHLTWWALSLPVLLAIMAGLGLSLGIIVSSLTTKYRDLQNLVDFGVQLLLYASPVIYPLSTLSGKWRLLLIANPMTSVIEIFRLGFLGVSAIQPIFLLYSAAFTVTLLLLGILVFNRVENTFLDTV